MRAVWENTPADRLYVLKPRQRRRRDGRQHASENLAGANHRGRPQEAAKVELKGEKVQRQ